MSLTHLIKLVRLKFTYSLIIMIRHDSNSTHEHKLLLNLGYKFIQLILTRLLNKSNSYKLDLICANTVVSAFMSIVFHIEKI